MKTTATLTLALFLSGLTANAQPLTEEQATKSLAMLAQNAAILMIYDANCARISDIDRKIVELARSQLEPAIREARAELERMRYKYGNDAWCEVIKKEKIDKR